MQMQNVPVSIYRMNEVEFDPALGEIRRGGEVISLRHKTSQVLAFLIEHRAAPVSKEDLIAHVWEGAAITDATIVGCVQELRKILGDSANEPVYIKTIAKRGYWFVAPVEEIAIDSRHPTKPKPRRPAAIWVQASLAAALALAIWAIAPSATRSPWEVAWWTLNEPGDSVVDRVSGSAARLPAGVSHVAGISGSALRFGGQDVVVEGASDALPKDGESRTMIAWVRVRETAGDVSFIFHSGNPEPGSKNEGFYLSLDASGRARFGGRGEAIGRTRLSDGLWHQIAGVFDSVSRTETLFVDAAEDGQTACGEGKLKSAGHPHWAIGRLPWGGTPFRGDIDDIRVYARPLRSAEIQSVYRCMSASPDLDVPKRGQFYFSAVHGADVRIDPAGDGESSARVRNSGASYAGIAFVKREPGCSVQQTWAADIGQDLEIEADLKVGSTDGMSGGPYFRSRRSAPGDGIVGGTSAGFWVQLGSTGQVRVKRLQPAATIAFSATPPVFDAGQFHRLSVQARGEALKVALDGKTLSFDQSGAITETIRMLPAWETARPKGIDEGSAGIAFSPHEARTVFGGQEARNIRVRVLD